MLPQQQLRTDTWNWNLRKDAFCSEKKMLRLTLGGLVAHTWWENSGNWHCVQGWLEAAVFPFPVCPRLLLCNRATWNANQLARYTVIWHSTRLLLALTEARVQHQSKSRTGNPFGKLELLLGAVRVYPIKGLNYLLAQYNKFQRTHKDLLTTSVIYNYILSVGQSIVA